MTLWVWLLDELVVCVPSLSMIFHVEYLDFLRFLSSHNANIDISRRFLDLELHSLTTTVMIVNNSEYDQYAIISRVFKADSESLRLTNFPVNLGQTE